MSSIWPGGEGDEQLYQELKELARRHLNRSASSQQPTSLAHNAYLRLGRLGDWKDRGHFLSAASRAMRYVLIDAVRRRHALKREAGRETLSLDELGEGEVPEATNGMDVLALNEALDRLASEDPELARLAEMRFFGGLTVREVADVVAVSEYRVKLASASARRLLA